MKRLASFLSLAASAALIYPLTIHPMAEKNCSDPSYHFVMADANGSVQKDTTNAKDSYCKVVEKNVELWK